MDIDNLKTIVKSGIGDDGKFSLSTTLLSSTSIDRISGDFIPDNTIRLAEARIEEPAGGQSIIVHGKGVDLPFKAMDSDLIFYIHTENGAAEAALKLTARGENGWNLATGFPPFEGSLVSDIPFSDSPKPTLFLRSHDDGDDNKAGMSFTGDARLGSMAFGLSGFLGLQNQTISGSVTLKKNGSELHAIDFQAEPARGINLGIATIDEVSFKIKNRLDYNPVRQSFYALPYIELDAKIPFKAQGKQHGLPVAVQIFNLNSDIRFTADFTDSIDAGLDEIKSLMNHISFGGISPPVGNFQLENVLQFSDFFFDFNLDSRKVTYISASVRSRTPWKILHLHSTGRNLVVQNVELDLMLFDPFGKQDKAVNLTGEVSIGESGTMVIGTRFPDWAVQGELKEGAVLNLSELVGEFLGSDVDAPAINLSNLDFYLSSGNYSLTARAEGDWNIGNSVLALKKIGFANEYSVEAGTTARLLTGTLNIGGVDLNLSANYQDADTGWQFKGGSGAGQSIPIGSLIENLTHEFGSFNVPSAIEELIIQDLGVTFETQKKHFIFTCEAKFPVDDKELDITITVDIRQDNGNYIKRFGGHITVGTLKFDLNFVQDDISDLFLASYKHASEQQSIRIKDDIVAHISSEAAKFIPDSLEIDLKDVLFGFRKTNTESKFFFGLDVGTSISLSNLPLVGREFPPDQTMSVDDLRLLMASKPLTRTETDAFDALIPPSMSKLSVEPDDAASSAAKAVIPKGLTVSAKMSFGSSTKILSMPFAASADAAVPPTVSDAQGASPAVAEDSSTDGVKWFNLQKTFGPVHFERVGVQYQDAVLSFLLDAALSAAGLTLSLEGLSISSPLSEFSPGFNLHGLGIDYQGGAVEIGGAFLRTQVTKGGKKYDEYDGAAIIKTEQFNLAAMGSYAKLDGHPSLFVYGVLDYPIGGPAFFFVTGLAAGFGYNRSLIVPPIDKIAQFPLVAEAVGGSETPNELTHELQLLQDSIPPAIGEVFVAVGIKFTSFKMIDSFALLTFSFGSRFEMNLLGLSTLIVPTPTGGGEPVTPLAEAQMALKANFIPSEGFLGVSAQLTAASYILSRDCRLTGGYAFYSWFSGEHEGDFVQTLGGYHPSFNVPAHYPKVPRLGFNWRIDDHITIKGELYYALTSSALMAGGFLQAVWEDGDISAWFKAGADFLISWKPYHYDARIYVDMGVSYTFNFFGTHTVTADIGADLHIWGPEFAGHAHIHLWIVSFDVSFGDSAPALKPISWQTFRESFLPKDADVCGIVVKDGLVKGTQKENDFGIINPKHFSLVTSSVIPSNRAHIQNELSVSQLSFDGKGQIYPFKIPKNKGELVQLTSESSSSIGEIGIGSMEVKPDKFISTHTITITRDNLKAENEFAFTPILKNVPAGLWGDTLKPDLNGQALIEQALTGFEITPKEPPTSDKTAFVYRKNLQYEVDEKKDVIGNAYGLNSKHEFKPQAFNEKLDEEKIEALRTREIKNSIKDSEISKVRRELLQSLVDRPDIDLSDTVSDAFLIAPVIEA
jgi:hypothetical protein